MAKEGFKRGTTSKVIRVFIRDTSQTDGRGLTGLVFNSAGLVAAYCRQGDSSATALTLVTATPGTWTSSGFVAVDATNFPGLYELGLPNAAVASGQAMQTILKGAANMAVTVAENQLESVDNQDGTRYGQTALPNAAAGAAGGLPTATNSSGQVVASSVVGNVGGNVVGSVGSVTSPVSVAGISVTVLQEIAARMGSSVLSDDGRTATFTSTDSAHVVTVTGTPTLAQARSLTVVQVS